MDQTRYAEVRLTLTWSIIAIATVALAVVLRLYANSNAVHMDEYDYLFVGKQFLAGQSWPTHTYIFGSDISWYLFGIFDRYVGGINGARLASAGLGILSLLGAYCFVFQLWSSRKIATVATLFLAISANHLYISTLATYDIVSFCFFTWTLATAVYASKSHSYHWAGIAACFFSTAILCKYNTIVYLPLIGVAMLYYAPRQALLAAAICLSIISAYVTAHYTDLKTLFNVQISGVHRFNSTRSDIAIEISRQIWLPFYLSSCAIVISIISKKNTFSTTLTLLVLIALSLPMPAYHLYSSNHISLVKHLTYSSLFLSPAVAYLLIHATERLFKSVRISTVVGYSIFIFLFVVQGILHLNHIRNGYPDTHAIASEVSRHLSEKTATLSEDPYIVRYIASGNSPQKNIKETGWLDNNQDGIYSADDVTDALWDRKFDLVLLTDQIHPTDNIKYRNILLQRNYTLIYNKPYRISDALTKNTIGQLSLYKKQLSEDTLSDLTNEN